MRFEVKALLKIRGMNKLISKNFNYRQECDLSNVWSD